MIQISSMKTENIPDAINLWKMQFSKYCYCGAFPNFMEGGYEIIESYIKEQIYRGNAIAAKADNHIVGFMAWQYFEFHNERTAFLPVTGHASSLKDECRIYEEMYDRAADMWVSDNRFNHMWMIYYDDHILKNRLYDLGFGAYVIDACVHPEYRNKGVGTALLREVFAFCNEKGKSYLHVSFESANSNAIRFWPKHFKPAIRSVRRTVNKDGNTEL